MNANAMVPHGILKSEHIMNISHFPGDSNENPLPSRRADRTVIALSTKY